MHIAPYLAAFGFLTVFHAVRVIRLRRRHRIGIGHKENAELERMIRIHGNHSEYVPMGMVLLFALEYLDAPVLFLHLVGGSLLIGRLLHAMALDRTAGKSAGRTAGMILTFASLLLASIGVLIFSFAGLHH